jgi:hypothetical protein
MKQFLSPSVLSATAGLVFILDKHPAGSLAFIAILLIFTVAPSRPR